MANGKKNGNGTGTKETMMCAGCDQARAYCGCAHLILSHFLFGIGLLSLLFAWIANSEGQRILGFTSDHLFHDAIAFMVAALFFKRKF